MRRRMAIVAAGGTLGLLLGGAATARAQDGVLTMTTRGGQTMTAYVRGKQMRISPQNGGPGFGGMIIDGSAGTMTMLMPQMHMYMQMTAQDMSQMAANRPQDQSTYSVTSVGTETVAGIKCTDYLVSKNGGTPGDGMELCAAPNIGISNSSMFSGGPFAALRRSNPGLNGAFAKLQGQGVLKVTTVNGGTKTVDMEVTKIDHTTPPDSLFQIPAGYRKMTMPAGMPGMGAPGMGAPPTGAGTPPGR